MEQEFRALFLAEAVFEFEKMKKLAEGALAQVGDDDFFRLIDGESNSVALIIKHMAGNMRSRWTDFLTSDGEKPWRQRDNEFLITPVDSRNSLMAQWNESWRILMSTVSAIKPEQALNTITIRGEGHTVLKAINRQLTHYSYHVGQIVFLAKHFQSEQWKSLSIPKGKSEARNTEMFGKYTPKQ